ncbi:hypothetical protein V6N12_063704 [Hibiscus sabdariffa]|uniref:Uncharacterized protein n=1 Tax=Hibiscus sabdariffa TaxID=183260 RepID=A0ABR2FCJ1_9ROSI
MKEPQRNQSSNKRGSSSKKSYATWSDEDSTEEDEVAHLCFLALQEEYHLGTDTHYEYPYPANGFETMYKGLARKKYEYPYPANGFETMYKGFKTFSINLPPTTSWSIDTQPRVSVPHASYLQIWLEKSVPNGSKTSQRSPTARNSFGSIKYISKYQEKANSSIVNNNMIRNCLSA